MKKNLVLLMLCAFGLSTMAQNPLQSVDHSVFATDATLMDVYGYGVPTAYPAGHTTFRVYGYLDNGVSVMQSVIGVPDGLESYIGTDAADGALWNYSAFSAGAVSGDLLSTAFIPLLNDGGTLLYDSYVTIGAESDIHPLGQTAVTFGLGDTNVPQATYWGNAPYSDAGNPDFIMTNEAWILTDVTGSNAYGVGPSFQVLLAQLTTSAADIHYGLNVTTLTDVPLAGGDTWITYWDASGLGGTALNEVDGTFMGNLYPAPPPPACPGQTEITLDMFDSYGDGWNDGTYDITDAAGTSVFSGDIDNAATTTTGGTGGGIITGTDVFCMDDGCYYITVAGSDFPGEVSFDLSGIDVAIVGAGEGVYTFSINTVCALGCLDSNACNYDSTADLDDGSCDYSCQGCIDTTACNFDSGATISDGSCEFTSCAGCMDSTACNYDSLATIDDAASCNFGAVNDTCATATDLGSVDSSTVVDNTDACVAEDPAIAIPGTACAGPLSWCGGNLVENAGVWYMITMPATDHEVLISLSNDGSGTLTDTQIAVFDGCGGTLVGASDDVNGLHGELSFACGDLTAGASYWILVDKYSDFSGSGTCNLDITFDEIPCLPGIFGCMDSGACNYDSLATDDDGSCCFDNCVTLTVGGSSFDNEISWNLYDAGGALVASGGSPSVTDLCLADGCHQMEMFDSYGDGWNGGTYDFSDAGGSIASGDIDNAAAFIAMGGTGGGIIEGSDFVDIGATGTCPVYGCLDTNACNFDSLADTDDGSCTYPGCTDDTACNYDSTAGCDDGSCMPSGCTDSTACNYDSLAMCDDGSCATDNDSPGCTVIAVPVSTPGSCAAIAVDLAGATDDPTDGSTGADRWYSFVAVSSVASIQATNVNAISDARIELYDDTFSNIGTEDATLNATDDEILNIEGLTVGNTYYIVIMDWFEEPSTFTCDLCIVQFPDSGCDLPPSLAAGPFTIQSQLKADYNAAASSFELTMTSTTTGLSYTSDPQPGTWIYIVYSGAPNAADTYDATLSANFEVANGAGTMETLSAGSSCPISVGIFDTYLVAAHACANKTWGLVGRPKAAPPQVNAGSFTWEFTQTSPTPGAAWEYTTPTGNRKLPAGGLGAIVGDDAVSMIMEGATYDVRIRANYDSGSASDFGPVACLSIAGATGGFAANAPEANDGTFAENVKSIADLYGESMSIYPNPCNGEYINLNISEVNDNKVLVDIVDLQGRTVQSIQLSSDIDVPFNQQLTLDNLSSGMYMVNVTVGASRTSMELVVQR